MDQATGLPVLYVETPYGPSGEESFVEVYDQAAEVLNASLRRLVGIE